MIHLRLAALIAGWFVVFFIQGLWAGPLVREATSSPGAFSRVIAAPGEAREMSLILDREEYDPLDVTGVGVIRFKRKQATLEALRIRLELRDEKQQVVESE